MAEQKHRPLSTSEQEIGILKKAFACSDGEFALLKSVRSIFLGFPVSVSEATTVKSVFKDQLIKQALRKKMYPILSVDVPIGEEADFWFGTETEILDKMPETIRQVVESKQNCLDMLSKAFDLLDNPLSGKMDLSYGPKEAREDTTGIRLLTRNKYVKTVVTGLTIVKLISGQLSESVEQAKDRLLKDSSK